MSKRAVKIRNGVGGSGWTSAKCATRYLKRGQARLVGTNEIEFIASDYRATSAERTMKATTEPVGAPPSRGPALLVVPQHCEESLRTFAPYPSSWIGNGKAA